MDCIDPWLTEKSGFCPICKYDCAPEITDDPNSAVDVTVSRETEQDDHEGGESSNAGMIEVVVTPRDDHRLSAGSGVSPVDEPLPEMSKINIRIETEDPEPLGVRIETSEGSNESGATTQHDPSSATEPLAETEVAMSTLGTPTTDLATGLNN